MSLKPCPDCDSSLSDSAMWCPRCGRTPVDPRAVQLPELVRQVTVTGERVGVLERRLDEFGEAINRLVGPAPRQMLPIGFGAVQDGSPDSATGAGGISPSSTPGGVR